MMARTLSALFKNRSGKGVTKGGKLHFGKMVGNRKLSESRASDTAQSRSSRAAARAGNSGQSALTVLAVARTSLPESVSHPRRERSQKIR